MLPLTLYLADCGHEITAEDDSMTDAASALLRGRGVALSPFVEDESVAVVYSSAISPEHPARAFARKSGAVAMRRGECLAVIARGKRLIAVAGSHGKTTTCAMLIDLFAKAGQQVDFVLGAQFVDGPPYAASGSEWLVAEIDESDGTIDLFAPEICVLLNADHDHHARYGTFVDYWKAFERLLLRTRNVAFVDTALRDLWLGVDSAAASVSLVWVGTRDDSAACIRFSAAGEGWTSVTIGKGDRECQFACNRLGRANASNASFAVLAASAAGCVFPGGALFEFRAVKRRQRCWYCSPEAQVYDDYAHHPTEIDAVLEQLASCGDGRTATVFQPHRYSRTKELKEGFAQSLARCDLLALLPVYAASEEPLEGGRSEDLLRACRDQGVSCDLLDADENVFAWLDASLASGRVSRVLFVGAGIGDRLARLYAERLAAREKRWGTVFKELGQSGGFATRIQRAEPLASKTTMRVGGPAEMYCEPRSLGELGGLLRACNAAGLPVYPLGRGSNLVVPDAGVKGLVLRLSHPRWSRFEILEGGALRVGAGLRTKTLCAQACREGLSGFEFLEGIPGSVGGVLRMNAGAMGGWVFDVVESVTYVTLAGEIVEAGRASLEYGYRYCRELETAIAIEATLRSEKGRADQAALRLQVETYQERRRETQPREPSAGCIFKNPEGGSAGRLIDELGLKGTVVGGAEISLTHGNFIINRGGASAADVLELVALARRVAAERGGVELHPEAMLFGSSWEEALPS